MSEERRPTPVVAEEGPDAGVPWHYGDPVREQRALERGVGRVDLSHRGVLRVTGPDRLTWLHSLTTQHLLGLQPGQGTTTLVLSPQGHLEHALYGVDDGTAFWAHTEPGAAAAAAAWLDSMRFMMRVEVEDLSDSVAVVWTADPDAAEPLALVTRRAPDSLGGAELLVPRDRLADALGDGPRAGTWAYEARRVAAGVPRPGLDTDARTIPNEAGLIGVAVHLDKGCYRGQETVARVHTLGRPPRRLVLLLLDGTEERLPAPGSPLTLDGRAVGFVGSSARHHELGSIALGLVKRNVEVDATLLADGVPAAQETLVDPEVGLHVRPRLGVR
ncbi:folate-binding protein YgfZ [Microlunatus spumicola]|uniref:Folate-binding protein YgfZ n=1 Tax=Microlunatus spumicola TaxID=81499 RepID=A0ABP6XXW4_9ACTN